MSLLSAQNVATAWPLTWPLEPGGAGMGEKGDVQYMGCYGGGGGEGGRGVVTEDDNLPAILHPKHGHPYDHWSLSN